MEYRDTKMSGGPSDNPPPYYAPTSGPAPYSAVPPPPGPYIPVAQGAPHVVVGALPPGAMVTTMVVQQMGPVPASVTCKSCNHHIVTRIETRATMRTHLFALILCLVGCWPFACVPYCMDSCNNADHYCPNCNSYIGSYMNN